MKTNIFPFLIGMEHEELEFDLEVLPDRIVGYDSYIYVGKEVKNFLNYPTDKVELIFYWDRLDAVVIFLDKIHMLPKQDLLKYFKLVEENHNFNNYKNEKINLYIFKESRAILYGNPEVTMLVLSTLLC